MKTIALLELLVHLHFSCCDWVRIQGDDVGNQPSFITPRASHPGARAFAASWLDKHGHIWLFGGQGYAKEKTETSRVLSDIWVFDSTNDTWSMYTSKAHVTKGLLRVTPRPRSGAVACGVTDIVFVIFGGQDSSLSPLFDTWLYDLDIGGWIPLHIHKEDHIIHPPARAYPVSWCLSDRLIIYGGIGYGGVMLTDMWEFSMKNLSWKLVKNYGSMFNVDSVTLGPYPSGRVAASSWMVNNKLYIFGGSNSSLQFDLINITTSCLLDDMWMFDLRSLQWQLVSSTSHLKPNGRLGSFAWVEDNNLRLFGGFSIKSKLYKTTFFNDAWKFDIKKQSWSRYPVGNSGKYDARKRNANYSVRYEVPSPRCCGTVWKHSQVLYIHGGLGYDKRGRYSCSNNLFINSSRKSYLEMYVSQKEAFIQRWLRELPPYMIFFICLSSFFSIGCIFFAFLFVRKLVEYYPRHKPTKSNSKVKYSRIDVLESEFDVLRNNLNNQIELEMDPV